MPVVASKVEGDALGVAIELADQAIRGMEVRRRDYAGLLALAYEGVMAGIPYAALLAFVRDKAMDLACAEQVAA